MKLSDKDLYRLRKAQLAAEKRTLAAEQAEQAYRELLLDIHHEYGVIGKAVAIDLETGEITAPGGKKHNNGKGQEDVGQLAIVSEGD